jgi:opacity protein-like surface antigen
MERFGILAVLCSLMLSAPAFADEDSGLYLGVGLGDFSSEIDDLDDVDIDFDDDSDAKRIFAGWRFNPVIAAQLDYFDFGESTAASNLLDFEADAKGIAPSIVATLPLGPVELFAKAGWLFYDLEVNSGSDEIFDDSDNDLIYGGGIGLTLIERLALRAEYEVIEISEFEDAEAVWITASWRF